MTRREIFVEDESRYQELWEAVDGVFLPRNKGLPAQVFQPAFSQFKFRDFDSLLTRRFWPVLQSWSRWFGDERAFLVMLDPDPRSYYRAHFGKFAAMSFSLDGGDDDYMEALQADPGGSPADALHIVGTTFVWLGSSRQWGVWGDRDFGLGVAATRSAWPQDSMDQMWVKAPQALHLASLSFKNRVVPPEFVRQFSEAYVQRT